MLTPQVGRRLGMVEALPTWAADNGCYSLGPRFDLGVWLTWLRRMAPVRATCVFAVVPDVVGDARATLARWDEMSMAARATGYPLAFAGQDGQEDFPVPWDEFQAFFVGGTTDWKMGEHSRRLVTEAKARGKWAHMGRVNSIKRLLYAERIGCDSADGTYLAFGPEKGLDRMGRALALANAPQPPIGDLERWMTMSTEKPKPTAQPKPTTTPQPPAPEPDPTTTPPDPNSWQAKTQPEKPFETDADKAAAEATKPEDLEFSSAPPTAEEVAAAEKVEAEAQPFERPAPPQDNPASPPAGQKETKA